MPSDRRIAVIGLGYVGLPVAVAFARAGVAGDRLRHRSHGASRSCARATTARARSSRRSAQPDADATPAIRRRWRQADFFIVTVPTPIDDAAPARSRARCSAPRETVGRALKRGDIVVYEFTVYPGATEEDCVPVLEQRRA